MERVTGVQLEPDVGTRDRIFIFSSVLFKLEFVIWFKSQRLTFIIFRLRIFDNFITEVHEVFAGSFIGILRRKNETFYFLLLQMILTGTCNKISIFCNFCRS